MQDHARTFLCSALLLNLVLLVVACAEPALASSCPAPSTDRLVGAWRAQVKFESGAFEPFKDLSFMYVFNQGGTLTESSNYDAAPPVPPAYGSWRAAGPDDYELKYEFFVTAPPERLEELAAGGGWLPAGRGIFTERLRLAADRQSFDSKMQYEAFDKLGAPVAGGGSATSHGIAIGF